MLRAVTQSLLAVVVVLSFAATQAQSGPGGPRKHPGPLDPRAAAPGDAAAAIQRAYDEISRASLAGNDSASADGVNAGTLLLQSKTAYEEALSNYQSGDYLGAREQAMSSADLSRATEELLMGAATVTGVPSPNAMSLDVEESLRTVRDLQNVSYRLRNIESTLGDTKVVPADAVSQARSLLEMGHQLEQQAQDLLSRNQLQRAAHTVRAADALTHAAEHLQNRYLLAAGLAPVLPPRVQSFGPIPPLPAAGAGPPR
ncbi:MAG: hypothetical protein WCC87_04430 [Candidatus Korobacteraceae bacterium]